MGGCLIEDFTRADMHRHVSTEFRRFGYLPTGGHIKLLIVVLIGIGFGWVLFRLLLLDIFRQILLVTVDIHRQIFIGGMTDDSNVIDAGFFVDWG